MVVFRSNKQIYVQVVDDLKGMTLCAAASNDKALAAECKGKSGIEAARLLQRSAHSVSLSHTRVRVSSLSASSFVVRLVSQQVLNNRRTRLWH
jgi:hypothetical protein